MKRFTMILIIAAWATTLLFPAASVTNAEELVVQSCEELMRMADSYRDDVRTADTVLGSAIDVGSLQMVRNFKLKKEAAKKNLEAVMKALELKGCLKDK